MVLPSRLKPWFIVLGTSCIVIVIFLSSIFSAPRAHYGDSIRVSYVIYNADGMVLGQSPTEGYTYKVDENPMAEPRSLFLSFYGKSSKQVYLIEIEACPGHDCAQYGGYTSGTLAWLSLRFEVRVLEVFQAE